MTFFFPRLFWGELFFNSLFKILGKKFVRGPSIKEEILVFSEPLSGRMQERIRKRFTHVVCHYYFWEKWGKQKKLQSLWLVEVHGAAASLTAAKNV